jgi:hypothetical protein
MFISFDSHEEIFECRFVCEGIFDRSREEMFYSDSFSSFCDTDTTSFSDKLEEIDDIFIWYFFKLERDFVDADIS